MLWHDGPMREFYARNPLSLAFFSNYTFGLEDDPARRDLISRAAYLIAATKPQHPIAIACQGQIYILEACENMTLEPALQALVHDAKNSAREPPIGWLTCLPRSERNFEGFEHVQNTELFVALDTESQPDTLSAFALELAHANFENRWFTHPKQLIICANGRAGFNFEHAELDGEPAGQFIQMLQEVPVGSEIPTFKKLSWEHSAKIEAAIIHAKTYAQQELAQREIFCFETTPFQSDFEIQLPIQVAITRIFKQSKITSEAVSMSHMPDGRYNTVYFDSPESVQKTYHDKIRAAKQGQEFKPIACDISTSSGGSFPSIALFGFTDTARNMIGIAYIRKADKTVFHIKCDGIYQGFARTLAATMQK